MKITIYIKPGDDPNMVAEQAKMIVERATGKPCNTRIQGAPYTRPKIGTEIALGRK